MEKQKVFGIFKNRNYVKLFLAMFTSQMGSVIGMMAFTFYLLDRFGEQPYYATITELMYSLPTLAVFFIVGVLADRMDRQKIAENSDWINAGLTMLLLGAIWVGWMPLIFAILFIRSAVSKFFFPAESALVQGILSKDEYTTAAGLNQMIQSIFMLFGVGLGALSYWYLGILGAILIDAISFIVSGLFIRSCSITEEVRLPNGRTTWKELHLRSVFQDFYSGLLYMLGNPLLLSIILGFFMFGIINGGFSVLPIFILKYKLAPLAYESMAVWMTFAFGGGILLGSIVASLIARKMKLYKMIIFGIFISGIITTASAFASSVKILFVCWLFLGFSIPFINVAIGGWLPQIVDPKMMGRVQGWINPIMMLAQSLTLGVIAVTFPAVVTVEMLFYGVGAAMIIVGFYYLMVLPKYEKREELYHGNMVEPKISADIALDSVTP